MFIIFIEKASSIDTIYVNSSVRRNAPPTESFANEKDSMGQVVLSSSNMSSSYSIVNAFERVSKCTKVIESEPCYFIVRISVPHTSIWNGMLTGSMIPMHRG